MTQRHRIAFALMMLGVALYAFFHLWKNGWVVWLLIIDLVSMPEYRDFATSAAIAAFVSLPIAILGAPCCLPFLSRSRLLHLMLAGFALFDCLCFSALWIFSDEFRSPPILVLAMTPFFTLTGILLIKPVERADIPEN